MRRLRLRVFALFCFLVRTHIFALNQDGSGALLARAGVNGAKASTHPLELRSTDASTMIEHDASTFRTLFIIAACIGLLAGLSALGGSLLSRHLHALHALKLEQDEKNRPRTPWDPHTWNIMESREANEKVAFQVPGITWLTDKRSFALLASWHQQHEQGTPGGSARFRIPTTYLVQGGGVLPIGGTPNESVDDTAGVPWFLKNASTDANDDNNICGSLEECLQKTTCIGSCVTVDTYVAQPHIPRPMLVEGHKFDLRLHVVVVARQGGLGDDPSKLLQAFLFEEVVVKLSKRPWDPCATDGDSQHTHLIKMTEGENAFYRRLLRDIPGGAEILESCVEALEACMRWSRKMLNHGAAINARQILGADIMVDEDKRAWVLEFNDFPSDEPSKSQAIYGTAYLPIKFDLPKLASGPILEGRAAQALKGWRELHF